MALHIYGPSFSSLVRSVRLYCMEKGVDVSVGMTVDGQPVPMRSPAHLALHPFGQVPVLLHDGNRVFETVAICRYLDRAFPDSSLEPEDAASRTLAEQWASALIQCAANLALQGGEGWGCPGSAGREAVLYSRLYI